MLLKTAQNPCMIYKDTDTPASLEIMGICGIGGHRKDMTASQDEQNLKDLFEEDMQRNPPGNPQMYVKEMNRLGCKVDGYYGVTTAPPASVVEFTSVGEQSAHSRLKPTKLLN